MRKKIEKYKKDVKILFHIHIIIKSFFSIIDITTKNVTEKNCISVHIENEAEKK